MTAKAAVWFRVFTDKQGAANKQAAIDKFAAHHGYEIVSHYELADSAWNGGKAGGTYKAEIARVLADAHKGEFSILVV